MSTYQERKEYFKLYRENNKDKIKERNKLYYENNKDKIKQYNKEYQGKKKEIIICECETITSKKHLERHLKTKKHINLLHKLLK